MQTATHAELWRRVAEAQTAEDLSSLLSLVNAPVSSETARRVRDRIDGIVDGKFDASGVLDAWLATSS
jgi:hypothetical protein